MCIGISATLSTMKHPHWNLWNLTHNQAPVLEPPRPNPRWSTRIVTSVTLSMMKYPHCNLCDLTHAEDLPQHNAVRPDVALLCRRFALEHFRGGPFGGNSGLRTYFVCAKHRLCFYFNEDKHTHMHIHVRARGHTHTHAHARAHTHTHMRART